MKVQCQTKDNLQSYLTHWILDLDTVLGVDWNDPKEYRHFVADLLKEVDTLKRMNNNIQARLQITDDQNQVTRAVAGVIEETSDVFKKKILHDRKYTETMLDMKDQEYRRLRVRIAKYKSDYDKLMIEFKALCDKASDLEMSKSRLESESALRAAEHIRVYSNQQVINRLTAQLRDFKDINFRLTSDIEGM